MPCITDKVETISKTMDLLIDFIVEDEFLGGEFELYLEKNKIEIRKESQLNDVLIEYLLEGKIQSGIKVIDYFKSQNKGADEKTLEEVKNSFISVFQIKKIYKNAFECKNIVDKKTYTLIPLVKTTHLRGIGLYDFIKARVIQAGNEFYLLEIFETFSELNEYDADLEAIKAVIKNPKIAVLNSNENLLEIKKSVMSFNSSFIECFKKDEIILSNKDLDEVLNNFYLFHTGKIDEVKYNPLDENLNLEFFEIEEFNNDFMINAIKGFKNSIKEYDTGIFSDSNLGIFIIPHLAYFNKILKKGKIENDNEVECVKYFLTSDKIPPSLLMKKFREYDGFLNVINSVSDKKYEKIEDIIETFKEEYKDNLRFSSLSILYNSDVFSKVLGEKENSKTVKIGRNDPCPCGSGKKYKKCCLNKLGEN